MRWLVTGAGGQLGTDMVDLLTAYRESVIGCDRRAFDISSQADVDRVLGELQPDVVVNCAAYTAVDAAETDEVTATRINGEGPGRLARWCSSHSVRLLHVSTDYVFAGDASEPYTEDALVDPRSAYGRSKAAGERAVLAAGGEGYVVRTAWVYGATGPNFVKTMCRLIASRDHVDVVDDQFGSPTWSLHLARALAALGVADAKPGVWHCTNAGETSWLGFTRAIFAETGVDPARAHPTTTAAFPRPAPRPAYSVMSDEKWRAAGLPEMAHWRDALHEAMTAVGEELARS